MANNSLNSNHSLRHYHDNNGIIIQFIFFELIQAFDKIRSIKKSLAGMNPVPEARLTKTEKKLLGSISTDISSLAGHSQKTMRIFAWYLNEGILAKVKTHCSLFANNLDPQNPELHTLQRHADRSWSHSLHFLDLVRGLQKCPSKKSMNIPRLKEILERMAGRLRRLSKIIGIFVLKFRDDENVLYFLLTYKDGLDTIYRKGFVFRLLIKMFPGGMSEAELFLFDKYSSRGFFHLLPSISQKCAELEKAS